MKILSVREYNTEDMRRWYHRVDQWRKKNNNNIIPQIAFVGFRKKNGEMRETGWVAASDDLQCAFYAKTKREVLEKYQKAGKI